MARVDNLCDILHSSIHHDFVCSKSNQQSTVYVCSSCTQGPELMSGHALIVLLNHRRGILGLVGCLCAVGQIEPSLAHELADCSPQAAF